MTVYMSLSEIILLSVKEDELVNYISKTYGDYTKEVENGDQNSQNCYQCSSELLQKPENGKENYVFKIIR